MLEQILGCFKTAGLEPTLQTYKPVLSCLAELELWETYLEIYAEVLSSG